MHLIKRAMTTGELSFFQKTISNVKSGFLSETCTLIYIFACVSFLMTGVIFKASIVRFLY